MMSYETRAYDNQHGDPVVVLVATGTHDVSRLAHLLAEISTTGNRSDVGAVVLGQIHRNNGGREALKLLADHGGPNFADDDHPGYDRYCDWPGCFAFTHVLNGPWEGWRLTRRILLCPDHSRTEHSADYTTDSEGNVNGAKCHCGYFWDEPPISLGVLRSWWQQHVGTQSVTTECKLSAVSEMVIEDLAEDERTHPSGTYHRPVFGALGTPHAWVCEACHDEGNVTAWPCDTALRHGVELAKALGLEWFQ